MCPDREILSAYLDGEVETRWEGGIELHLAGCAACQASLARMQETRGVLQSDGIPEMQAAMVRVRKDLLARCPQDRCKPAFWRRHLAIPMPVALAAAALLLLLGVSTVLALYRSNIGLVRITRKPTGGTEIQIAAPMGDIEALLKSFDPTEASREDVITLPKKFRLIPAGVPRMGREAEFVRKKTW